MRVLLTGHHGYLGSVMSQVLKAEGHEVMGLDTNFFKECILGECDDEILTIQKDLRDVTIEDLQGIEAVIHLAALSNDPLGDLDSEWTYSINHQASIHLAKIAKEAGVKRFLYSSSCSLYGAAKGEELLTETAPLCPLTPYAISKVRTEKELANLADQDFSPTFMRNATVYGFSPRFRIDLVLNNLVGWAFTTGRIRILSDGTAWRPLVHVEDVAQAFAVVLKAPREKIYNQAFNIGINSENYQVRDLAQIVKEAMPDCEIEYAGKGGADPRNYRVSFNKFAATIADFNPKWNARRGVRQLVLAFTQHRLTLSDFQGRKYIRLSQLKHLISQGQLDHTLRWKKT